MKQCNSYSQKKIIAPEKIAEFVNNLKKQGLTIATLNGSFDLLHAGHLFILHEASKQADRLIVALNSDASIKKYKDPKKPYIPLEYRLEMMASIGFVDFVTWFEETDPRNFLTLVKPHIHVNGEEYGLQCIEAETIKSFGGKLHLVRRIPGLATSEIVEKIKKS